MSLPSQTSHALFFHVVFQSRTLLNLAYHTLMSSDNGGKLRKEKEPEPSSEMEAKPAPKSPAARGVGDGVENEAQVGYSPQGSGEVDISRSLQEDSAPLVDAEGNAETVEGDFLRPGCGVVPTNWVIGLLDFFNRPRRRHSALVYIRFQCSWISSLSIR